MDGPLPAGLVSAWERLLADPARLCLDPDSGVCEAIFTDPVVFPLQRREELAAMLRLARERKPLVVGEVGADKLGGFAHWLTLPTVDRAIACEIRGLPCRELFHRAYPDVDFCWLPSSSRDARSLDYLRDWLDGAAIDVLFLDGDKSRFVEDFDTWLPMMDERGLVFMHDVTDREPKVAFQTIAGRGYRARLIVDLADSVRALRRQEQGIPPANPHEGWLRHWAGKSAGVGVVELGGK